MKYNPYFLFDGKAEEATYFYAKAFNGETRIMKYKDTPPDPNFPIPEEMKELVIHSEVMFGDMVFMICDGTPMQPARAGNNVQVSVTFEDKESFQKVYDVLSEGAKIAVAPEASFFAEYYAMFEDKFGVNWQFIVPKAM